MIKAEFQSPLCRENAPVKSLDQQPCSVQNNRLCTGSARSTNSCPYPAVTHKRLATQEKKLLKNNDGVGYSANSIYLLHITHLHACWNSAGLGSCRKDLYRDKVGLGCSDSRALKEKLPRSSSESRLGLASTAHGQKKIPGHCYCSYLPSPPSTFLWWLAHLLGKPGRGANKKKITDWGR